MLIIIFNIYYLDNPMINRHLADLKPGQSATILAINIDTQMQHRFCALGFRSGQEIRMLRQAWMKGPLHVQVGMTEVMLRRCDARHISITAIRDAA